MLISCFSYCRTASVFHTNHTEIQQGWDSLNNNVNDIEMAIDLGRQRQNDDIDESNETIGTEMLLKRVAGEVSNKGNSGGLLKQIKDFNAFLERAALALEGRKG